MANFIFKKKKLIKNILKLQTSFLQKDINFKIFYSVKTNFSEPVLKTINDYCFFEIVSNDEWNRIKKYHPREVILNGPSKTKELIDDILKSNIKQFYINIDNDTDIDIINSLAKSQLKKIKVGLRVYMNRPNIWSRFGFDIESKRTYDILSMINGKVEGLHFHFSTNNFRLQNYKEMFGLINSFSKNNSLKLKYIDIGGGLPGASDILFSKAIYENLPSIVKTNTPHGIKIFSEVGRNLIEDTFDLEAKIISKKHLSQDSTNVVIDTNIMHFPCFWEKRYGIEYKTNGNKQKIATNLNIFGNSCMQIDKIAENFLSTSQPEIGDKVVLTKLGAYSLSQASNFISDIPSIIEEE